VAELFRWKGTKKLYARLNLLRHFSEVDERLLVTSINFSRRGNIPIGKPRLPWESRTWFHRSITNGDNHIELGVPELIPGFAANLPHVNFIVIPQNANRIWVNNARRLTASAISSEPIPSDYVDVHQVLGKNAADGISGGKKYNRLVILVGEHLRPSIWALIGFPKSLYLNRMQEQKMRRRHTRLVSSIACPLTAGP
jgi:hypothetical protein